MFTGPSPLRSLCSLLLLQRAEFTGRGEPEKGKKLLPCLASVSQLPCTLLRSWLLHYRTEVFHTTQETLCKLTGTYIDSSWSKAWRLVSIRWLAISGVLTHTHTHAHTHPHPHTPKHTHTEWGCARGSFLTFWWRLGTNMTLGRSQTMIDQVGGASPLPPYKHTYITFLSPTQQPCSLRTSCMLCLQQRTRACNWAAML